jgi:hypothetical protein
VLRCLDPGIRPLEAALRSELLLVEVVGEKRAEAVEITGVVALDALPSHVLCALGHCASLRRGLLVHPRSVALIRSTGPLSSDHREPRLDRPTRIHSGLFAPGVPDPSSAYGTVGHQGPAWWTLWLRP